MILLKLTKEQFDELADLQEGYVMDVKYKGIDAFITKDEYGNFEYNGETYLFNFFCPVEIKLGAK